MDLKYKLALAGIGLFGGGFASGYFSGDLIAKKKGEARINEEIQREISRLHHPSNRNTLDSGTTKTGHTLRIESPIEEIPAKDETSAAPKAPVRPDTLQTDYSALYSGETIRDVIKIDHTADPDDPEDYDETAEIVTIVNDNGDETTIYHRTAEEVETDIPEELKEYRRQIDDDDTIPAREKWRVTVISPDEFRTGMPGQARHKLTYYEGDDTVADEDGVPIDDPTVFGDGLSQFGLYGTPNDTVYIRNLEQHVDMHITKVRGSFSELVLGVPLFEEDDSPRKMRAFDE